MSESIFIPIGASKSEKYKALLPQIEALVSGEDDRIANLANTSAVLKEAFDFLWVGFYLVKGNELVLGPFQGPIACTRIGFGKGVCGTAWKEGKALFVPDVGAFPGHIACSSGSKSEVVFPLFKEGKVALVMDIDSDQLDDFDESDKLYLGKLVSIIEKIL
jgi:GAF domain-containing protein